MDTYTLLVMLFVSFAYGWIAGLETARHQKYKADRLAWRERLEALREEEEQARHA